MSIFVTQLNNSDKKDFYSKNVFHERQMNSCPIGCDGCAVSASTTAKGNIKYSDLYGFYKDAQEQGSSLRITKVEGYDPVFVTYSDNKDIPFAQSVKDAVDLGHQIITPICTTGSWKSDRTKWQLEELGKLSSEYRRYYYPSGSQGQGFALSVPREIRPFAEGRYDYEDHLRKIVEDINLLTINGNIDVLIYFNSKIEGDYETAVKIKANVAVNLPERARRRASLLMTNFNSETLPESCYRYPNSVLVANSGFYRINPRTLNWDDEPPLFPSNQELGRKLLGVQA